MYQKKRDKDIRCPFEYGMSILAGKWKSRIICLLGNTKPMRYGELKTNLLNITDGVLASTLIELHGMDILEKVDDQSGNGMEVYKLTTKGMSLIPFLKGLCQWSRAYYTEDSDFAMTNCVNCKIHKQWLIDNKKREGE